MGYNPLRMSPGQSKTEKATAKSFVVRIFKCQANGSSSPWGEDPIGTVAWGCYSVVMNALLLIVVLLLLFGGGGFYFGGPVIGGGGLGLILVICLVMYVMGGFRTKT